jgi:predicted ATP-binding protein involved in virulence
VVRLVNALLPTGTRFTGRLDTTLEPRFIQRGVDLPLGALSDGYRAYIGLICDLLYHLHLSAAKAVKLKLTDLPGMVLVDDVDLHLHPAWQREVVPKLAGAFRRLQFVLTTHSPLVAGTLRPENIFLTESDPAGPSVVRQITEPIHGLNADQVLTSSYFDLDTTRAPGARRNLARLARRAENGDPDEAIKFLRALSKKPAPE